MSGTEGRETGCQSSSTSQRLHPIQGLSCMTDGPQAGGSGVRTLSGATRGGYRAMHPPGARIHFVFYSVTVGALGRHPGH